jgi:hypothetical protein
MHVSNIPASFRRVGRFVAKPTPSSNKPGMGSHSALMPTPATTEGLTVEIVSVAG